MKLLAKSNFPYITETLDRLAEFFFTTNDMYVATIRLQCGPT